MDDLRAAVLAPKLPLPKFSQHDRSRVRRLLEVEVVEYLNLIALRHGTANTGYAESMKFLEERRRLHDASRGEAAIIPCAEEVAGAS